MAYSHLIRPAAFIILLIIAGLLLGANYSDSHFYLDDFGSISHNPKLLDESRHTEYLLQYKTRLLTYASFLADYRLHGMEPAKFKLTNLFLHLFNCALVAWLTLLLMRACRMQAKLAPRQITVIAGIALVIFAVLPLNTQPVNYIVQRAVLLCTLGYLACIACYIKARLFSQTKSKQVSYFILSAACFAFALMAKQTAVTIPVVIVLIEWLLLKTSAKRLCAISAWLLFAALAAISVIFNGHLDIAYETLDAASRETNQISRVDYLATQLVIIWEYIRLFFVGSPLRLEYDIALRTFPDPVAIAALLGHIGVMGLAFVMRHRAPVACFGVLLYYIAHLVESSIIPIIDIAFEHRTYLPNAGLTLALASMLGVIWHKTNYRRLALPVVALWLVMMVHLTWQRNEQWADPEAFFRYETQVSPDNPRAWSNLAGYLVRHDRHVESIGVMSHALNLYDEHPVGLGPQPSLMINYIKALRIIKDYKKAARVEANLLEQLGKHPIAAEVLNEKGIFLLKRKRVKAALRAFKGALTIDRQNYNALFNSALCYGVLRDYQKSMKLLRQAEVMRPNDEVLQRFIAKTTGRIEESNRSKH